MKKVGYFFLNIFEFEMLLRHLSEQGEKEPGMTFQGRGLR